MASFRDARVVARLPKTRSGKILRASIRKIAHDRIWEILYAPAAAAVDRVSGVLDHMQFLSIRRYLGFVFVALVVLLLALALWQ